MTDPENPLKPDALIAGLDDWLPSAVTPEEWVCMMGNYEFAVGYSFLFWPAFVRFEGYVLRQGFSEASLRGFEAARPGNREAVEWVLNHVHIVDIHSNEEPPNEAQIRHLGRVLKSIHEVKLKSDFPDLSFVVEFNDEPGLDPTDYQFSFWQTAS
jgi:hypothetical protein